MLTIATIKNRVTSKMVFIVGWIKEKHTKGAALHTVSWIDSVLVTINFQARIY